MNQIPLLYMSGSMLEHSDMDNCTRTDKFKIPVCGSSETSVMFQDQPALHMMVDLDLPSVSSADPHTGVFGEFQCSPSVHQTPSFNEAVYCENPAIAFILGLGNDSDDDSDTNSEFESDLCDDFLWELELHPLQEHCILSDICNIRVDGNSVGDQQPQKSETVINGVLPNNSELSEDCVDSSCGNADDCINKLKEVNLKWNMDMQDVNQENEKHSAKVHFAPQESLVTVHVAEDCDRTGPWCQYAIDRARFAQRILELEPILSPCFDSGHRAAVFERLKS